MKHLYLAAKFKAQKRIRAERERIESAGLGKVIGTWLDEESGNSLQISSAQSQEYALRDFDQIEKADLLIVDTTDENTRGEREVEYGFAQAVGVETWVVGPRRNVFHHLSPTFETWDDVLAALAKEAREAVLFGDR